MGTSSVATDRPNHSTRRPWKHQEPLGGGPVCESEWTRPDAGLAEAHGWRRQRTGWYYIETRPAHQAQFNQASRTNCQQNSGPIPKPEGCLDEEVTWGSKCRAPSAGVECSDSTCESTTRICTREDDARFTCARTTRLTRPGRIPPSLTGRTTCRTHIYTAWRQRIRSGGKTMPRGSNWTNGDGSMSWTGARPTRPTNVSGPCGSSTAGTKARVRDSHRDRRTPSASPTLRVTRPTKTQPRRSQSRRGASAESQAQRKGRSSRRRASTQGPLRKFGRGRLTQSPRTPPWGGSLGGAPVAGRRYFSPHPACGDKVNLEWTMVAGLPRDPGWNSCHRTAGTSLRSPGLAVPRRDRGEVASRLPDPWRPGAVLHRRAPALPGAHGSAGQVWPRIYGDYPSLQNLTLGGWLILGRPVRMRVKRDVEPGEVRRFLRQELLKKVGHSEWNKPRLYRYDLADEREPTPSVQSVVVIPSDPDQPEAEQKAEASQEQQEPGPSGPIEGMVLDKLVASPVTSLPRTLGRDIHLPGNSEESPRSREGRVAVATLEQEMGWE